MRFNSISLSLLLSISKQTRTRKDYILIKVRTCPLFPIIDVLAWPLLRTLTIWQSQIESNYSAWSPEFCVLPPHLSVIHPWYNNQRWWIMSFRRKLAADVNRCRSLSAAMSAKVWMKRAGNWPLDTHPGHVRLTCRLLIKRKNITESINSESVQK